MCPSQSAQCMGAKRLLPHTGNRLYRVWRERCTVSLTQSPLFRRPPFVGLEGSPGLAGALHQCWEALRAQLAAQLLSARSSAFCLIRPPAPLLPGADSRLPQASLQSPLVLLWCSVSLEFIRACRVSLCSFPRAHRLYTPYRHNLPGALPRRSSPSIPQSVPTMDQRDVCRLHPG